MIFSVSVRSQSRTLVRIDHFEIPENHICFLFGESGIGKSIFAKSLFGLLDGDVLDIQVNGAPYEEYKKSEIRHSLLSDGFFVFQEPSTHMNPLRTISGQISEGSLAFTAENLTYLKMLWKENSEVFLRDLLRLYPLPYRPSGGEKQRVLLAMALKKLVYLASNNRAASLFVFDEPSGSLDDGYRNLFLSQLFKFYRNNPFTILFITHDYSLISQIRHEHKAVLPSIRYYEAQQDGSQTKIVSFKESAYLDWLGSIKPARRQQLEDKTLLLDLSSSVQIFGRKLNIRKKNVQNLQVHQGEIVYLKAESGAGKTSLAKVIMGLIRAERLRMHLCGREFTEQTPVSQWKRRIWGQRATMVFQHADEALNLKSTVRGVFNGLPRKIRPSDFVLLQRIQEFFDDTLDPVFLDQRIVTLSGGQKQRLNLLRALFASPEFLILDEPFNGLDLSSLRKIIPFLLKKQSSGMGMLLISHNEEIIDRLIPEANRYYLNME